MSLIKAMATVAGLTGLSRIAGFLRDILTASIMGAGPMADAFFVALKLPNLFRRVTAEGAFSVSFVPLYSEALEKEGEASADRFAGNALSFMLCGLSAVVLLAILGMPWIVCLIAPGFQDDPNRYAMAVEMTRVTFPYLLLMSVASLMGGMLNAHNRFGPFAVAPVLFNLSLIAFLLMGGMFKTAGHAMAWGVFVAGILQCAMLLFFLRRSGIVLKPCRPHVDVKIKRLLKLMGPGVVGAGVMHINLFADMIMGSFLPAGSISYLYYADRLNQLPLGMVGIAVGTALLPMLSRAVSAGNEAEASHLFNRALEVCLLLALPAATGLFVASYPIVVTLFRHGEFGPEDAAMTTLVLTAYALGMPAYIVSKVFSTAFWARQDTVTPVKASVVSALLNVGIGLYLVFGAKVGVVGIAVATAMAGWVQVALLAWGLKRHDGVRLDVRFKKNAAKIALSCFAMAVFLYLMRAPMRPVYLTGDSTQAQIFWLIVLIGGASVLYGTCILVSGAAGPGDLKRLFRRGRSE